MPWMCLVVVTVGILKTILSQKVFLVRLLPREISATITLTSAKAFTEWNSAFFFFRHIQVLTWFIKWKKKYLLLPLRLKTKTNTQKKKANGKNKFEVLLIAFLHVHMVVFHWLKWFLTYFLYFQCLSNHSQTPKCYSIYYVRTSFLSLRQQHPTSPFEIVMMMS